MTWTPHVPRTKGGKGSRGPPTKKAIKATEDKVRGSAKGIQQPVDRDNPSGLSTAPDGGDNFPNLFALLPMGHKDHKVSRSGPRWVKVEKEKTDDPHVTEPEPTTKKLLMQHKQEPDLEGPHLVGRVNNTNTDSLACVANQSTDTEAGGARSSTKGPTDSQIAPEGVAETSD